MGRRKGSVARLAPRAPTAAYLRPNSSGIINFPHVATRDPRDDVAQAWVKATGLAIHALQNSGWIAGGVEQAAAGIVGTGLKLNATPDWESLGWSSQDAASWARLVERRWKSWSNTPAACDIRGRQTVGQLTAAAVKVWFGCGEITAFLRDKPRPFIASRKRVQMVPPYRLVQDSNEFLGMHQGVISDADDYPLAYRFRLRLNRVETDLDILARDSLGRPQVLHVFDGLPTQTRGITPMAPALKIVRQYDQLADATLTTTMLQTVFAATLESAGLSNEAFDGIFTDEDAKASSGFENYMDMQAKWSESVRVDLGQHGRINHLFPGQKLTFHGAEHPGDNYLPFSRGLLREIARCLGITYEQLTGDYAGPTYASLNVSTADIGQITDQRRDFVAVPFVRPIYETWLDEEVATGRTPFPGGYPAFLAQREAACMAEFIGPPRPSGDALKDAKAASERLASGVTSLDYESGRLGLSRETVNAQRAREREEALAVGLPDPFAPRNAPAPAPEPDEDDQPEDSRRGQ